MKKLLRIDSSVRKESSKSSLLADIFCAKWSEENPNSTITTRHVGISPPNHPTLDYTVANYTPVKSRTREMDIALSESDTLVQELLEHDEYVFAIPMYNFSIPSTLKAYIDNVVRIGMTFNLGEDGGFTGGLIEKKMTILSAKGARYSPPSPIEAFDMLTPYMTTVMGFMGVVDITFVVAEDLDFSGPEIRDAELEKAKASILSMFS